MLKPARHVCVGNWYTITTTSTNWSTLTKQWSIFGSAITVIVNSGCNKKWQKNSMHKLWVSKKIPLAGSGLVFWLLSIQLFKLLSCPGHSVGCAAKLGLNTSDHYFSWHFADLVLLGRSEGPFTLLSSTSFFTACCSVLNNPYCVPSWAVWINWASSHASSNCQLCLLAIEALFCKNILPGALFSSNWYSCIWKAACQEFPAAAKWWFTLRLQQKLQILQILQCKKGVAGFLFGNSIQLFNVRKKCCCVAIL